MMTRRQEILRARQLPFYGRLSAYLGHRPVLSRLVSGTWLDLLSGYDAPFLVQNLGHPKITGYHALDHRLDPELPGLGIEIREAYVETELPFADGSFDNITMMNGLEHLWHPQEILTECHRALATGGMLQITVPTWLGKPFLELVAFTLKQPQPFVEMNDHKMYYDVPTLWPMLVRAGFEPRFIRIQPIKMGCSLHASAMKRVTRGGP
jgi:SAM-dependent methyltransferase